jgi:hypothetical protein
VASAVVAERLTKDFQIGFWQRQLAAVDAYIRAQHHRPANWADLNPGGPRNAVPVDPAGVLYEYDAAVGRAVLSPRSPLYPLPSTLGVK